MNTSAIKKLELVSVEDYLAGELVSPVKYEYLGGVVYALAGATNIHSRIAMRIASGLAARLQNKPCEPYGSDTKIRVKDPRQVSFYYPDVSVICESNPPDDTFQDKPLIVVEVASPSTRRIDAGEKKDAYLTLPSLAVYLIVEQDFPAVIAYRRTPTGFQREVYDGLAAIVLLPEIEAELPLAEIYAGIEFAPESSTDSETALADERNPRAES